MAALLLLLLLLLRGAAPARALSASCDSDPTGILPSPFNETAFACTPIWNNFVMRYAVSEDNVLTVVLSTLYTSGWVAMGFSDDGMMVGSGAIAGWIGRDKKPHLRQYYMSGQTSSQVKMATRGLNTSHGIRSVVNSGAYLFLSFQVNFQSPVSKHWLLFAYSSAPPINAVLKKHEDRTAVYFDFKEGSSTPSSYPHLLKRNHGALAIVGWGVLLPIGAIIARYLRHRDPLWFYLHSIIQLIGFIIGLAAVVAGVSLYDKLHANIPAHRGLGIFVLVLGILQVLAFFLRPKQDSKYRRFWNWYHHWFGRLALFFAAINIVVGIRAGHAGQPFKVGYGISLTLILLVSIILEVMRFLKSRRSMQPPQFAYNEKDSYSRERNGSVG